MDKIQETLTKYFKDKAKFVLLFGSTAKGSNNSESDIDIGVYYSEPKEFSEWFEDQTQLSELFQKEVDLIYLNESDTIITMQVLANGNLVFCNDISLFHSFKAQKISEYIDFKQDRKIIEDNLLRKKNNA